MRNGWIAALALAAVFLIAAAKPVADDANTAKLEEIKAIVGESLRLQRIEMHRRLFPGHRLGEKCDLDSGCETKDFIIKSHSRAFRHAWAEDCSKATCEKKEQAFVAIRDAEDAATKKELKFATLRSSWLVTASDKDFDQWLNSRYNDLDAEALNYLKARRAEKAQGK